MQKEVIHLEQLKAFRENQQLSRSSMAKEIGVSKSLYEKVEYGIRLPSQNFLCRLKKRFPSFDVNLFFSPENSQNVQLKNRN